MRIHWPDRPVRGDVIDLDDPRHTDPAMAPRALYEEEDLPEVHVALSGETNALIRQLRRLLRQPKPLTGDAQLDYQVICRELQRRNATPADIVLGDWCPSCGAAGRWWVDDDSLLICMACTPPLGSAPMPGATRDTARTPTAAQHRRQQLGAIGPRVRFQIFQRDGFACHYCGRRPPQHPLQIDHVLPIARGGTNHPDNLVAACWECNIGKRDHLIGQEQ